jgi:hypothetical protein
MAGEGDAGGGLLSRIFDQLAAIETTVGEIRVDVATLKANGKTAEALAVEVKDQGLRLAKLEIAAAGWAGAAGASTAVGRWVAGIVATLLTAGVVGVVGYLIGHK